MHVNYREKPVYCVPAAVSSFYCNSCYSEGKSEHAPKCLKRLSVEQEFGGHDFISCDGHASHSSDLKSYPLQRSPGVSDHSRQVLAEFCLLAQLHSH